MRKKIRWPDADIEWLKEVIPTVKRQNRYKNA